MGAEKCDSLRGGEKREGGERKREMPSDTLNVLAKKVKDQGRVSGGK